MNLQEQVYGHSETSQLSRLRKYFDEGGRLTVKSAMALHGVYALSQRCGELIREGYPLATRNIKVSRSQWCKEYRKA